MTITSHQALLTILPFLWVSWDTRFNSVIREQCSVDHILCPKLRPWHRHRFSTLPPLVPSIGQRAVRISQSIRHLMLIGHKSDSDNGDALTFDDAVERTQKTLHLTKFSAKPFQPYDANQEMNLQVANRKQRTSTGSISLISLALLVHQLIRCESSKLDRLS